MVKKNNFFFFPQQHWAPWAPNTASVKMFVADPSQQTQCPPLRLTLTENNFIVPMRKNSLVLWYFIVLGFFFLLLLIGGLFQIFSWWISWNCAFAFSDKLQQVVIPVLKNSLCPWPSFKAKWLIALFELLCNLKEILTDSRG